MVGHRASTEAKRLAPSAYQIIFRTLNASLFAGALMTIVIAVFGTPFNIQNQIGFIAFCVCAALPVFAYWSWRQLQLERTNTKLRRLAYHDAMLGCMNRRGFTASVGHSLKSASLQHPCALLAIDADNFKRVNDSFGHLEGDTALCIIAEAIRSCVRSTDMFGRIGGEEFGVFLPGTDSERARTIAARIRETVAVIPYMPDGTAYQLSVSIGGAIADTPSSFADIFAAADKHLFAAKKLGRNRVAFTTPGPTETDVTNDRESAA